MFLLSLFHGYSFNSHSFTNLIAIISTVVCDHTMSYTLSRHFYALDEVHAALNYCSRRNDPVETLFWCQELLLSGHIGETISTLFESWLWHKGPLHPIWLIHAWTTLRSESLVAEDILLSAAQLSMIPHDKQDHSLWNILALSSATIPDRVIPSTPTWVSDDMDNKELYLIRALYQGKARSAWWMAQQLTIISAWKVIETYAGKQQLESHTIILEALQQYDHLLGYRSAEYDMIILCTAILYCCCPSSLIKELPVQLHPMHQEAIQHWNGRIGRKAYRSYPIPSACLYGVTYRGKIKWSQSTVSSLNNIEPSLIGCPFWEEAIAEYGIIHGNRIQWNSDDDLEDFYERYFPDDIPDEWSKAEKAVSHGDGLLAPTEVVTFYKYARSTFTKWSYFAWNIQDKMLLQLKSNTGVWNGTLSSIYVPITYEAYDTHILQPVRKRLRK